MNKEKQEASTEAKQIEKKLCVVIPYCKAIHQPMALLCAIRSLCDHLLADFKVVVIGDKEDWFSPELVHVPSSLPAVDTDSIIDDAFTKVTLVEHISDEFILMMPDTFLLTPLSVSHMLISKASESLEFNTGLPFGVDIKQVMQYLTAMPDEPLTMEICQHCSSHGRPVVVDWHKNEWLLPVVSANPNPAKFEELVDKRFFMRYSKEGWSGFLQDKLKVMYPNKSKYEV